jgi:hypothetical protein
MVVILSVDVKPTEENAEPVIQFSDYTYTYITNIEG